MSLDLVLNHRVLCRWRFAVSESVRVGFHLAFGELGRSARLRLLRSLHPILPQNLQTSFRRALRCLDPFWPFFKLRSPVSLKGRARPVDVATGGIRPTVWLTVRVIFGNILVPFLLL